MPRPSREHVPPEYWEERTAQWRVLRYLQVSMGIQPELIVEVVEGEPLPRTTGVKLDWEQLKALVLALDFGNG